MHASSIRNIRIARLVGGDVRGVSDHWRAFRELILSNEKMYPEIQDWLRNKVTDDLMTPNRIAYVAYSGDKPVAAAVLKRGVSSKFCHLRVDDSFQDKGLGDMFFSVMALDARPIANEVHFTLPANLWEERQAFFRSFGFDHSQEAGSQYRSFEPELRCSAPFGKVWTAVQEKLPMLLARHSVDEHLTDGALLMSVRPRYAEMILSGVKTVEIRRKFSSKWSGQRVCLYASHPLCSVVGEACIGRVVSGTPVAIWNSFGPRIGCTKEEFDSYVGLNSEVFAVVLHGVRAYSPAIHRDEISRLSGEKFRPPLSYAAFEKGKPWARAVSIASALQGRVDEHGILPF